MAALLELLQRPGPGRVAADGSTAALGRAEAMLTTWADGAAGAAAALSAARARPDDARALNALAVATLRWRRGQGAPDAIALLQRACAADTRFVPAAWNLAHVLFAAGHRDLGCRALAAARERADRAGSFDPFLGAMLPLGFDAAAVDWSRALQACVLGGSPAPARAAMAAQRRPAAAPS
jgi:hypothetical protein